MNTLKEEGSAQFSSSPSVTLTTAFNPAEGHLNYMETSNSFAHLTVATPTLKFLLGHYRTTLSATDFASLDKYLNELTEGYQAELFQICAWTRKSSSCLPACQSGACQTSGL